LSPGRAEETVELLDGTAEGGCPHMNISRTDARWKSSACVFGLADSPIIFEEF
jgi:hypothetical protein